MLYWPVDRVQAGSPPYTRPLQPGGRTKETHKACGHGSASSITTQMSHLASNPPLEMPLPCTAGADTRCERLVAQLVATPAPPLALLNHTGSQQATLVQKVLEDSTVRAHFSDRCVFVSCEGATSAEVVVACLASALGLEPSEDAIDTVLEDFATHSRTLIILDNVDAIYSPEDPEQQEATEVLLASLAAVDEVTLIITFCGTSLPEYVAWTSMNHATDDAAESEPQPSHLPLQATIPAAVG